ncbi:MAG TPA: diguanylate cyclase [Spirochaetota bacterium]|nr:diguanylate cyclase [Spirochaetota bacterium]
MTNNSMKSRIIYLVDRDELSRTSLGNEFRKLNFRVITASGIGELNDHIRESAEPAILLIDLEPATADDVLALIKNISDPGNIPVLFMVRQADSRLVHSMDGIRSCGYVLKDIGFPVIADSVKNVIMLYDRSDAKESENRALKRKDARMEYILNRIEDGIIEIDNTGVVAGMNHPAEKILECKADRIVGKTADSVFVFDVEENSPGFSHYRERVIQTGTDQYFPDDTMLMLPNGEKKNIRGFVSPLDVEDDSGLDTMIIFRDVKIIRTLRSVLKQTFSEMHKLVNELHKSMYMDSLTDLPNRISLYEHINRKLADNDSKSRFALVFVDIDNFRNITKTFGHIASDGIISDIGRKTAAYRLQKGPDKCFVARLSSDEFVIMFKNYENNDTLLRKVIELNEALSSGYEIDGVSFDITVSMGISRYPEDGDNVSDLMRKADIALSKAKEKGKQSIKMFNGEFDKKLRWNLSVEKFLWAETSF